MGIFAGGWWWSELTSPPPPPTCSYIPNMGRYTSLQRAFEYLNNMIGFSGLLQVGGLSLMTCRQ